MENYLPMTMFVADAVDKIMKLPGFHFASVRVSGEIVLLSVVSTRMLKCVGPSFG